MMIAIPLTFQVSAFVKVTCKFSFCCINIITLRKAINILLKLSIPNYIEAVFGIGLLRADIGTKNKKMVVKDSFDLKCCFALARMIQITVEQRS